LTPLGFGREYDRLLQSFPDRRRGECCDRVEQAPAVSDRANPELAQIVSAVKL